jgi:hypothetical protein
MSYVNPAITIRSKLVPANMNKEHRIERETETNRERVRKGPSGPAVTLLPIDRSIRYPAAVAAAWIGARDERERGAWGLGSTKPRKRELGVA